jgi:hypothetical protein
MISAIHRGPDCGSGTTASCFSCEQTTKVFSMDNQIADNNFHLFARERSHEEARQTVAINRMLIQSLVVINGGAATVALAYYGAHNVPGLGRVGGPNDDYPLLSGSLYRDFRRSLRQANHAGVVKLLGA